MFVCLFVCLFGKVVCLGRLFDCLLVWEVCLLDCFFVSLFACLVGLLVWDVKVGRLGSLCVCLIVCLLGKFVFLLVQFVCLFV